MERYDLYSNHVADSSRLPAGACKPQGISLAIGFFDGVHLGHREVIRQAVVLAKQQGYVPAVMTFDPHPRVVLGHGSEYSTVLTPVEDKLALFAELGVEAAYIIHFDRPFSEVTAGRFVDSLIAPIGVRVAVVGFDFKFGYRGEGGADTLREYDNGRIQVHVIAPVFEGGLKVSSTRIREMLAGGEPRAAAGLLERPYVVRGIVVHGDARGRLLGYPTANVNPSQPYVIPRFGVYAIEADVQPKPGSAEGPARYRGVLNVGVRPTFDAPGGQLKLEAHLFDYDGDLYGRELALIFHSFIRPERKFESIDQLVDQIGKDAEQARALLAESFLS